MTIEQAKQELVNRYRYLYENAYLILAPYMHEQTDEEYQESVDRHLKEYGRTIIDKPMIYLNINSLDSINFIFEEFLLSDKNVEDTELTLSNLLMFKYIIGLSIIDLPNCFI